MRVRFLLDENLSPRLKTALWRLDRNIDVLRVGDEGAPPFGTADPDILRYTSTDKRILVTDNRSTIPDFIASHYQAGEASHWGIIWLRPDTPLNQVASSLHLIWAATEDEEWLDRTDWVPF
jgi:predicted nuclease of predicted toxin-antitoxin system